MNFNVTSDEGKNKILLEINEDKNSLSTTSGIDIALEQANLDIRLFDETIESVKTIKQNCDKIDYALAASSGAWCGILDMFFVGKPGETPLGNITDNGLPIELRISLKKESGNLKEKLSWKMQ